MPPDYQQPLASRPAIEIPFVQGLPLGLGALNALFRRYLRTIEMIGVLMRIFSFSLVSWLGPASPFMFVWIVNTVDAVLLSWCSVIKKDAAYTLLNVFWVFVGVIGILRAGDFLH